MRKPEGRLYLKKRGGCQREPGKRFFLEKFRPKDGEVPEAVQCFLPSKEVKETSFREIDLAGWGWASGLGNLKFWRFPAKGLSIQPCTLSSPSAFSFMLNEETNLLTQQQRKLTSVIYKQSSPRKT